MINLMILWIQAGIRLAIPESAVRGASVVRHVSDCRSRGHEFHPGPVPYYCGDFEKVIKFEIAPAANYR